MRIGIDVMGGDDAPYPILEGALEAAKQLDSDDVVVLYGDEKIITSAIHSSELNEASVEVVGTTEIVEMDESPVDAVRGKQDSSLVVMCKDGSSKSEKPLDALISAGNTGAFVAGSQMYLRRLEGVHRPGIAAAVPTFAGTVAFTLTYPTDVMRRRMQVQDLKNKKYSGILNCAKVMYLEEGISSF